MDKRTFNVVLGICGFLSILFQAIGLFSPAWLIFDMHINMEGTSLTENVGLGLFAGQGCVDTGDGKHCAAFTMDKLSDAIAHSEQPDSGKTAANRLLSNFLPLQLMTIFGGIASIIALCAGITYGRMDHFDSSRKCSGAFGSSLWILSGILLIAAVGYEANQYTTFKNGIAIFSKMPEISDQIQLSVHFPWAVAMTGIGAFLCFVNGLIFSLRLCYTDKDDTGTVGTWNKFTNHAI